MLMTGQRQKQFNPHLHGMVHGAWCIVDGAWYMAITSVMTWKLARQREIEIVLANWQPNAIRKVAHLIYVCT